MPFIRNLWYVAAWSTELAREAVIGRTIIGEPIAIFRRDDGTLAALEDRCPHRHAPLSLGRVEGDALRCMYHGLTFGGDGRCRSVPGTTTLPPNADARTFPVVERHSWIWVWPGDPAKADHRLIPEAFGLDNPEWVMRESAIDYAANYELINDNLTDLCHLDFTHETTLGGSTGVKWSETQPTITTLEHGIRFERWFVDRFMRPGRPERADTFSSYHYWLPGLFIMTTHSFPAGTAAASNFGPPTSTPLLRRVEQQAVTPISATRTRYLYAAGVEAANAEPAVVDAIFAVVNAAFAEDKRMIEAQQRIWDLTPQNRTRAFIPQDRAPMIFRRLISRRINDENRTASDQT